MISFNQKKKGEMKEERENDSSSDSDSTETNSDENEPVKEVSKKVSGMGLGISIPKNFKNISPAELNELIKQNKVVVIDVRGLDFEGGNVKGAINVPLEKIESHLSSLIEKYGSSENVVFVCKSISKKKKYYIILIK